MGVVPPAFGRGQVGGTAGPSSQLGLGAELGRQPGARQGSPGLLRRDAEARRAPGSLAVLLVGAVQADWARSPQILQQRGWRSSLGLHLAPPGSAPAKQRQI